MEATISLLKSMGFSWEKKTIGVKWDSGLWCVNVMLLNEDGSRKPAYGFLKYDTVEEAVDARNAMEAA